MATNWLTTVVHLTVLATTVGILGTRITIEVTLMSTQEIYMKGVNVVKPLGSEILVKIFILPTDATTLSASFATPTQPHRCASRLDADTQPLQYPSTQEDDEQIDFSVPAELSGTDRKSVV